MDEKQFDLFQRTIQYAVDEFKENGDQGAFDMDSWLTYNGDSKLFKKTRIKVDDYVETFLVSDNLTVGSCGTTACLAGTAVLLHGGEKFVADPRYDQDGALVPDEDLTHVLGDNGKLISIEKRAKELLGLTESDVKRLFFLDSDEPDDIDTIVEVATRIARRHGHALEII